VIRNEDKRRCYGSLIEYTETIYLPLLTLFENTYHVFTLPFQFVTSRSIGNEFPSMKCDCVTELRVEDVIPFQHKFFVRISKCFPMLKDFHVTKHIFLV